jgi:hypothetical protein
LTKVFAVPVYDDGSEEVEACHAEVLTLSGAVADFALATDAEGVFQGMVNFAFIQTDLSAALHVGVEQPVDDEQRPFHPSDFFEGFGQLMLAGIGCKFA